MHVLKTPCMLWWLCIFGSMIFSSVRMFISFPQGAQMNLDLPNISTICETHFLVDLDYTRERDAGMYLNLGKTRLQTWWRHNSKLPNFVRFSKRNFPWKLMKRGNPQNLVKMYLGIFICSGIPVYTIGTMPHIQFYPNSFCLL